MANRVLGTDGGGVTCKALGGGEGEEVSATLPRGSVGAAPSGLVVGAAGIFPPTGCDVPLPTLLLLEAPVLFVGVVLKRFCGWIFHRGRHG